MTSVEQEQLLDALAQDLVVLDGRVFLAQQVFPGHAPEQTHLIAMQNCVRQMIEALQSIPRSETVDPGLAIPSPSPRR